MKKFMVVVFVLIAMPVFAMDWTRKDTYRELVFQGLLTIDYFQTRTIVQNPDKYFERNPVIGKHPNQQTVDIYMVSVAIIHPIISYMLPPKSEKWRWINRENWQYISSGIEILAIGNNFRLGIGVNF